MWNNIIFSYRNDANCSLLYIYYVCEMLEYLFVNFLVNLLLNSINVCVLLLINPVSFAVVPGVLVYHTWGS